MNAIVEAQDLANIAITALLRPTGYKILVRVTSAEERSKTAGGIYMPAETAAAEAVATMTGEVIALGPDAYADPKRFAGGAWCRIGDHVVFRAFAGLRLHFRGADYRLLNDDTVEAVTSVPDEIGR